MESRTDVALRLFSSGANCCQAVVLAMAGDDFPCRDAAMRMGACFGGGMGRGETCGAVTGGLMWLGLRHGPSTPEDQVKKKEAKQAAAEFFAAFSERHQTHQCRELIQRHGKRICPTLIADIVSLLEQKK